METAAKYTCSRCLYHTNNRTHYSNHLRKKTPCDTLHSTTPITELLSVLDHDKEFKCPHCKKSFSQIQGLSRHKKVHANDPVVTINNNNITDNSHNNSHNVNIENLNLTVSVQLLPFGKEDTVSIQNDMEFMNRCVQAGIEKAIPAIVKQIFLNENLPQNHNVKLGKEHHPAEMKVYKTDIATGVPAWELAPRSVVLQELVDKGATVLQTHNNLLLNTSDGTEEAKENYDRRNTKIINVKSKRRGTASVKDAVLSKFKK